VAVKRSGLLFIELHRGAVRLAELESLGMALIGRRP
jgi:hypothetical protein